MLRKDSSDKELPYHIKHDISQRSRSSASLMAKLCECRTLIFICTSILLIYFYSLYNEANSLLVGKEDELKRYLLQVDSYKAQVQVIYEHKQRLESSLAAAEAQLSELKIGDDTELQKLRSDLAAEQEAHNDTKKILKDARTEILSLQERKTETEQDETSINTELKEKLRMSQNENYDLQIQIEALQAQLMGMQHTTENKNITTKLQQDEQKHNQTNEPDPQAKIENVQYAEPANDLNNQEIENRARRHNIVEFVDLNHGQDVNNNVDESNYARRAGAVFIRDGQMPNGELTDEERLQRQQAADEADREIRENES